MTALLTPANIITALIALNFMTFAAFAYDKQQAEDGGWRISEATLLQFAFMGGTIGAYAGRRLFRHKTRKQPFSTQLHAIALLQVAMVGVVLWRLQG